MITGHNLFLAVLGFATKQTVETLREQNYQDFEDLVFRIELTFDEVVYNY